MKSFRYFACAALAFFQAHSVSAFCFVPQPRRVCAEYFASTFVVEATLIQAHTVHDKDDPESIQAHIYTLDVNRSIRGKIDGKVQVYDGNDSGRVTFDWKMGAKYLLFLIHPDEHESLLAVDSCGNSGPLNKAAVALSEIETIKSSKGEGTILGVVSHQALSFPISGVHVEADGTGGKFVAISNGNGQFEMKVPPGSYSVKATDKTAVFSKADISYEDPRKVQIEAGGCAQIQFAKNE